jgi:two-component system sensor histidine kinase KdpD
MASSSPKPTVVYSTFTSLLVWLTSQKGLKAPSDLTAADPVIVHSPVVPGPKRLVRQLAVSSLAIALLTSVCYTLRVNLATTGFLFLLVIVAHAMVAGFPSSALISIFAVACLDYFFTLPLLSFQISDPFEAVALFSFLATALVITRFASKAREEAETAELRRKSLELLYEVSRRLLLAQPEKDVCPNLLRTIREVFDLRAVCLFDAVTANVYMDGEDLSLLTDKVREAYTLAANWDDVSSGVSVRCLRFGGGVTGAIAFQNLHDPKLTAGPLAMLAVATLERAQAFKAASRAAAAAESEGFRSAILDALAHEFKTPLATILTGASALYESQSLGAPQRAIAEAIETEVSRLGRLTSRLLRMAQLDSSEVKPRMERTDLVGWVAGIVDRYADRFAERSIEFRTTCESAQARIDEELLRLALTQLLENATKYSVLGSAVVVDLSSQREGFRIRVWNSGSSIPSRDWDRVFERFFRGSASQRIAPGSGLGLYVARKIAVALGGALEIDRENTHDDSVAFCLELPSAGSDSAHAILTS